MEVRTFPARRLIIMAQPVGNLGAILPAKSTNSWSVLLQPARIQSLRFISKACFLC